MNFFPLCTAIVWPTISGTTVERRDHVFTTFFSFARFIPSIFSRSDVSTNGPFFNERLISRFLPALGSGLWALGCAKPKAKSREPNHFGLRCTMNRLVSLRRRVLYPFVGWPHGVTG